jgi:hypothetical protein
VAAREQQGQLVVVGDGAAIRIGRDPPQHGLALLPGTGALATQVVERAVPSDRHDPSTRIRRNALTWPLLQGRCARLLRAVLR